MVVRAGQGFHGTVNQSSAFKIEKSLRFRQTQKLTRSNSANNVTSSHTVSFWFKVGARTQGQHTLVYLNHDSNNGTTISIGAGGVDDPYLNVRSANGTLAGYGANYDQDIRDYSAWYHFVMSVDYGNFCKVWINGVLSENPAATPTSTAWGLNGNGQDFQIGGLNAISTLWWDGYMAEFHFVDGSAIEPTGFGFTDPLTNTWRPKKYTGTYGTNGFYLDFSDSSNLGADRSGNGNNFTASGFIADDLVPDSPSGVTFTTAPTSGITTNNSGPSNYCTLNPLYYTASGIVQSDGNLKVTFPSAPPNGQRGGTLATTNAFYAEASPTALSGGSVYATFGVIPPYRANSTTSEAGSFSDGWSYVHNGRINNNNSLVTTVATYTVGDIIGVACDPSKGTIEFFKNGTSVYSGTGIPNVPMTISVSQVGGSGASGAWVVNCGQKDFSYTPPSGFLPICTANLPTPTSPAAVRPDKYFNTVLYTGNSTTLSVTGVNFQPDLVWIKNRSSTYTHSLQDSVRGFGTNTTLRSDTNVAEDPGDYGYVSQVSSDGFTVTEGSIGPSRVNGAFNYVAWCWKAGGAAVENTDGSITSQVSANQDAGFSIVSWTGTGNSETVGHGLGVAPSFYILKSRDNVEDWAAYFTVIDGSLDYIALNTTNAKSDSGLTAPTSTVIYRGTADANNEKMIAYCFAEVEGYSKFGSYEGNGNADGPFIHLGFKPKWFMLKRADVAGGDWVIMDNERSPINVMDDHLSANSDLSERVNSTETDMDFLSNGVKLRNSNNKINYSGQTFVYAAFAEAPTNNLFGGQANAR